MFAGGGWPQKKSKGYIKLSEWWVIADQFYNDKGDIQAMEKIGLFNTNMYAEYGITDKFTIMLNSAIFSHTFNEITITDFEGNGILSKVSDNSIGDMDLSFKYGIYEGNGYSSAITLTAGIPLGKTNDSIYKLLQTGDGEFNQILQLDLGKSLGKGYANVYTAYNNRTEGFSDEFRFGFEFGRSFFTNKLGLTLRTFGIFSMRNGSNTEVDQFVSVFSNNTEYISIQPEINYNFSDRWGLSASVGGAVYGKNIMARPSYSFGVFSKI